MYVHVHTSTKIEKVRNIDLSTYYMSERFTEIFSGL